MKEKENIVIISDKCEECLFRITGSCKGTNFIECIAHWNEWFQIGQSYKKSRWSFE